MHFLKLYEKKIIKHDFLNKFNCTNTDDIPKLKKITLNFGCKNLTIQKFSTTMLALEIMVAKKCTLTVAKNANILLKIQKGQYSGCKVVLRKQMMYNFLTKLFVEILPKLKSFLGLSIKTTARTFSFKLNNDQIMLKELESQYPLFSNLTELNVNILTTSNDDKKLKFLIKSFKFPNNSAK